MFLMMAEMFSDDWLLLMTIFQLPPLCMALTQVSTCIKLINIYCNSTMTWRFYVCLVQFVHLTVIVLTKANCTFANLVTQFLSCHMFVISEITLNVKFG